MDCLVVKSSVVYEGVEVEAASVRDGRFLIMEYEESESSARYAKCTGG